MIEFYFTNFLKAIIFPPGGFILLIIIVIILFNNHAQLAKKLLIFTASLLYLLSTSIVTESLLAPLEIYPALTEKNIASSNAQAIVVLSSGRERNAMEYDGIDIPGAFTLGRLRYAARLHRITQLPILVSGGLSDPESIALSELMTKSLIDDFGIQANWQENESRNSAENAKFSWQILNAENITSIYLVSDAWHMRRTVPIFEKQGFNVTPAPTRFRSNSFLSNNSRTNNETGKLSFDDFLPNVKALGSSYFAIHEMIGVVWYYIRY